jgi:hypothetical protein
MKAGLRFRKTDSCRAEKLSWAASAQESYETKLTSSAELMLIFMLTAEITKIIAVSYLLVSGH